MAMIENDAGHGRILQLMANPALSKGGLLGVGKGVAAQTSNMFWIMCGVSVLVLVLFLIFRKSFVGKRAA